MIHRILTTLACACVVFASFGGTTDDFTVRCKIDISRVTADEPLYEAGPLHLAFRMAGKTAELQKYDKSFGNYLNFPMPNGSCPVIEATMFGLRVGIPLGFLKRQDGVHDVRLFCAKSHFVIEVEGHRDENIFRTQTIEADLSAPKTLSDRVKSAKIAILVGTPGGVSFSRPVEKPIQYWTPPDHNAWVGDVSPGVYQGRLHVFYLFDRRHHTSKQGAGGHFYEHLSSDDLVHWTEHPVAIPLEEWWTSEGTGTPFVKDGRLCLSYGLHTSRITKDPLYPIGGTYAESEDGIHFVKSGKIITDAQNPSIYNMPGGGFELVTSYGGKKGIFRSDDLVNWKIYDGDLPFRGDCPSLFDWHGHRYLLQGFKNMAYSPDGRPGSFIDWTNEPDTAYDGLGVPMVVPWKGDRRLYIGWMRHIDGWGGWLVFRELVFYPDGHLGLKWVPEIKPPVAPVAYRAGTGEKFVRRFASEGGRPTLVLTVDPAKREASFADDVPDPKFGPAHSAENVRIGGLRCLEGAYEVKLVVWYDPKADATIFDSEIGGVRTMICRRAGRFKLIK
ncbi:MAG: hypothetical protein IKO72_01710 [Kiritimatiellae bacterium]|nr:hypothetical protein [Kiritimatiellia bacterium]